jgi:hypothetical protein
VDLSKEKAIAELFAAGIVNWKLKPEQRKMYDKLYATDSNIFVINCSRRLGKSFFLCLVADEYARQNPDSSIKYAAPSKRQVRQIIRPLFTKILRGCPQELKPWWDTMDSCYIYPNGAKISIVGCDKNNIESLRGEESDLGIIDEAGIIQEDLHYIVKDIIMPQTLTVTSKHPLARKIILASTPPTTPAHAFVSYVSEAQCSGKDNYVHMTIYDNSLINRPKILEYARDAGCLVKDGEIVRMSTTFRREYMAEIVTEEAYAILPEFNQDTADELCKVVDRPPYFDAYVAMDIGLVDLTVVLFGYWDFARAKLIIEDEVVLNYRDGLNTKLLVEAIKSKEQELWQHRPPYLRIMDDNHIMCQDLSMLHNLNFIVTDKDNKEAAVNAVRLMVHSKSLIIDPKCKTLIAHMKYGVWDKNKRKFDRSGEFGHFDAIDALVYMVRNINRNRNPYPTEIPSIGSNYVSAEMYKPRLSSEEEAMSSAFADNNVLKEIREG